VALLGAERGSAELIGFLRETHLRLRGEIAVRLDLPDAPWKPV